VTTDSDFADLVLVGPPADGPPDEAAAADAVAAALVRGLPGIRPPATGLDVLLRSVSIEEGQAIPDPRPWTPTPLPGISRSILHVDIQAGRVTAYYHLEPGARIPTHRHTDEEDVYMLEGDLHCADGTVLGAGDYLRSAAGTRHRSLWSVGGCLCIMVSPLADEREQPDH
jgi:hypothetical protein